jgi:hypothetical protein
MYGAGRRGCMVSNLESGLTGGKYDTFCGVEGRVWAIGSCTNDDNAVMDAVDDDDMVDRFLVRSCLDWLGC